MKNVGSHRKVKGLVESSSVLFVFLLNGAPVNFGKGRVFIVEQGINFGVFFFLLLLLKTRLTVYFRLALNLLRGLSRSQTCGSAHASAS